MRPCLPHAHTMPGLLRGLQRRGPTGNGHCVFAAALPEGSTSSWSSRGAKMYMRQGMHPLPPISTHVAPHTSLPLVSQPLPETPFFLPLFHLPALHQPCWPSLHSQNTCLSLCWEPSSAPDSVPCPSSPSSAALWQSWPPEPSRISHPPRVTEGTAVDP